MFGLFCAPFRGVTVADVRVGVIGTGFGARVVAPVFAATPGCAVVDVVSARDADAIAALCRRADVDLVSVHSPPFLHRAHAEAAIRAGRAVLCDKPFGRDGTDAAAMVEAARDADVVGLVNLEFRWEPARRHVADLIAAGELGAIERVTWTHVSCGSRVPMRPYGWLFDRAAGGGWLGAWGSHAVDTLRWWLGDLTVVAAALETRVAERLDAGGTRHDVDADDGFTATLRTSTGASVTVDATFAAIANLAPRVVIAGSTGVAEVVADRRVTVRHVDGTRSEWQAPDAEGDPHLVPMRRWAEVVRDAVQQGEVATGAATFADGLAMVQVLDAIRAADAGAG
jgi:predicted dehydrogenase